MKKLVKIMGFALISAVGFSGSPVEQDARSVNIQANIDAMDRESVDVSSCFDYERRNTCGTLEAYMLARSIYFHVNSSFDLVIVEQYLTCVASGNGDIGWKHGQVINRMSERLVEHNKTLCLYWEPGE